jgi:hypothetical protein
MVLAGCGRIHFEPGGAGPGGGDGDGGTQGDGRDLTIDGANDRPNVVFLTSTTYPGTLGGLAGADAECAAAASRGGLPGTFVAFLSTVDVHAFDRLAGSRGWVRTDGVAVTDTIASFRAGAMFHGVDHDESGLPVPAGAVAWTGTVTSGASDETCGNWTSSSGFAVHGVLGGAVPEMFSGSFTYGSTCADPKALYCFEVGHDVPVEPAAVAGARVAFLAKSATHGAGIAGLDSQCQSEAGMAGLTGTFLAAVATSGTTIASRFPGGATWAKPDGTPIVSSASALFDGSAPLSFINQHADGTYAVDGSIVRTGGLPLAAGTSNDTCNSWTSTSGATGIGGRRIAHGDTMWSYSGFTCSFAATTYCLQL